jgi:hypothetical protein
MSLIRNVKVGKLDFPVTVQPGDTFKLSVNKKLVHSADIVTCKEITHWAVFEIGSSGLAYAIGDHRLKDDLERLAAAA